MNHRLVRCGVGLGLLCLVVGGAAFGLSEYRKHLRREYAQQRADWRQQAFEIAKEGDGHATVMDSKLLLMLAGDNECRQLVTHLAFDMCAIDKEDASNIARLQRVESMSFYCTEGTEHALLAARSLPVKKLWFNMPNLKPDNYLVLTEFADLRRVEFRYVMDDEWTDRLKTELPDVEIDAPYRRSIDTSDHEF